MTQDVSDLIKDIDLTVGAGMAEPGTYQAILTELVPFTYTKDGVEETLLRWTFEGKGFRQEEASSLNTGPRSKAFGWMTALLGHKPAMGESIGKWHRETDGTWKGDSPLIGLACQVSIIDGENGYPKIGAVVAPAKA